MKRKKLKTDHVIADSSAQRFVCRRCGVSEAFKLPQSLTGFAKRGREFMREHQKCKPSGTGIAVAHGPLKNVTASGKAGPAPSPRPPPTMRNVVRVSIVEREDLCPTPRRVIATEPTGRTRPGPRGERLAEHRLLGTKPEPALPRSKPCGSCPYRLDVPAGVWDPSEYSKLPEYDRETFAQPIAPFFCHTQDGRLCAGWLGCHEPDQLLAVRLGVSSGKLDAVCYDFSTDVPLFGSGAEAAKHGTSAIARPGPAAREVIRKLVRAKVIKGEAQLKGITPHMGIVDEVVAQAPRTACPRCVTLRDPRQPCPTCGAGGRPPRAR